MLYLFAVVSSLTIERRKRKNQIGSRTRSTKLFIIPPTGIGCRQLMFSFIVFGFIVVGIWRSNWRCISSPISHIDKLAVFIFFFTTILQSLALLDKRIQCIAANMRRLCAAPRWSEILLFTTQMRDHIVHVVYWADDANEFFSLLHYGRLVLVGFFFRQLVSKSTTNNNNTWLE